LPVQYAFLSTGIVALMLGIGYIGAHLPVTGWNQSFLEILEKHRQMEWSCRGRSARI
jgi:hypothetical protein